MRTVIETLADAAISANGDVLAKNIAAIGINADWIKAGTITGRAINNGNGLAI